MRGHFLSSTGQIRARIGSMVVQMIDQTLDWIHLEKNEMKELNKKEEGKGE